MIMISGRQAREQFSKLQTTLVEWDSGSESNDINNYFYNNNNNNNINNNNINDNNNHIKEITNYCTCKLAIEGVTIPLTGTVTAATIISPFFKACHQHRLQNVMLNKQNAIYKVQKIFKSPYQIDTNNCNSNSNSNSNSNTNSNISLNNYGQLFCSNIIRLINYLYNGLKIHYLLTVAILLLTTTCSLCTASLCNGKSWWDSSKHKCTPCTLCKGDMIPLRPCQIHQDTICGSIYDLKIDWVLLSKTEPNWKERRKFEDNDYGFDHHQLTAEQLQQLENEITPLDWQTAALFLAVLACLLFFIVAACILVHHMRQWRRMERRLDQDVEELSTRLMAKLAEVQSLEGGTFFIGNADALGLSAATTRTAAAAATVTFHQPQRVNLPEKSEKQQERRFVSTMKSGNVYIEESGSKC